MNSPVTRILWPAFILAALVIGATGCGTPSSSTTSSPNTTATPSDDARQQLQRALSKTTASTFAADATIKTTSSDSSLSANLTTHVKTSSLGSISGTVKGTAGSSTLNLALVTVPSLGSPTTIDTSADGGVTWTKSAGLSLPLTYLELPLAYLASTTNVIDEGQARVGSAQAELFHADVTGNTVLSSVSTSPQIAPSLKLQTGTVDVYVDHSGRVIKISGSIEGSSGSNSFTQHLLCTFSGFGETATITPPPA